MLCRLPGGGRERGVGGAGLPQLRPAHHRQGRGGARGARHQDGQGDDDDNDGYGDNDGDDDGR